VIVRCARLEHRTVELSQPLGEEEAVFEQDYEFPVADDDPDAPVTFEVWTTTRRRCRQLGRIDVPFFCFTRNKKSVFELPLRDVSLPKPAEGPSVGTILVEGFLEQPLESLLLPRPTSIGRDKKWGTTGAKSILQQIREIEDFLQEFEVFSQRFMYHCDTWRALSIQFRTILFWDSPMKSLATLVFVTVLVLCFHEYTLPLSLLFVLLMIMKQHPAFQRNVARSKTSVDQVRTKLKKSSSKVFTNEKATESIPADSGNEAKGTVQERLENERRWVWGQFSWRRLRLWDPPHWSTVDGAAADEPRAVLDGIQYHWRVEVNQLTDPEGWRYANQFGANAVWRTTLQPTQSMVRQRRHIGRPRINPDLMRSVTSTRSIQGGKEPSSSCVSDSAQGETTEPVPGKNGLEFGMGKTPVHDMLQQYLLRISIVQHHMEFWMEWYERRKNLLFGMKLPTAHFAVLGVFIMFMVTLLFPTRWVVLLWIYAFAWEGLMSGKLMQRNRNTFMHALKDTAMTLWLPGEDVAMWNSDTRLQEVVEHGVEVLKLREWIRREFFGGTPMLSLRSIHRCSTLGDLAALVIWSSDQFARRRQRQRVWYKSTLKNLLDHVPSDMTLFQQLTYKGEGNYLVS